MNRSTRRLLALAAGLLPAAAMAHSEAGGRGALDGFLHPVLGLDHLCAMLSVGIVSARMGGRAIWTVPATFVLAMIVGGILGLAGIALPYVEFGVALSVLALGCAIVFVKRSTSVLLTMAFVACFGILHGHAHGVEAPQNASPFFYSFGFIVSTSLIHLAGVFIGHGVMVQERVKHATTYLGIAISVAGLYFLRALV
ncbi:MAG TPA: HupE/UreJ family protein [Burkholderiaceae bacterium]|nr:HupE/UreJ family protein [Burkholderiaceae bacterium]